MMVVDGAMFGAGVYLVWAGIKNVVRPGFFTGVRRVYLFPLILWSLAGAGLAYFWPQIQNLVIVV